MQQRMPYPMLLQRQGQAAATTANQLCGWPSTGAGSCRTAAAAVRIAGMLERAQHVQALPEGEVLLALASAAATSKQQHSRGAMPPPQEKISISS